MISTVHIDSQLILHTQKHLLKLSFSQRYNCRSVMKLSGYSYVTLLVLSLVTQGSGFEPVSLIIGGIVGAGSLFGAYMLVPMYCQVKPCCNNRWIPTDLTGLKYSLKWKLHGQHLASSMVFRTIESHVKSESPSKALVLSFHGPVGVGKTFVSQAIAENMYAEGLHSKFVHLISAEREFFDRRKLAEYKNLLHAWVEGNLTVCDRSMFIFEEVDKLPAGLLDVLVPFVEYRSDIQRIKYSKAIFIFLSNTGSSDIVTATFNHMNSGKEREAFDHSELENIIVQAINEDNEYGLSQSQLTSRNLISAFVPFLPLEKEHVIRCISDAVEADKSSIVCPQSQVADKQETRECISKQAVIDGVMRHLTFSPREQPLFSDTGCKRALQKIDDVIG